MKTLLLLLIVSCSSLVSDDQKKILSAWTGKSVRHLEAHPFFSKVPLKYKVVQGKEEIRNYEETGKYRTKGSCAGLGGCSGLPSETCQNIFTIKNGIIQKYEMKESCLTNLKKMP